jgi:hypothetical protein
VDATQVSDRLFGRGCRLPIAAWVLAHDKRFMQSRPPTFGRTSRSNVTQELARLVDVGMLYEERPDDGKVWYEMTGSPLWKVIGAAVEATGLSWQDDRLSEVPPSS